MQLAKIGYQVENFLCRSSTHSKRAARFDVCRRFQMIFDDEGDDDDGG
jgi:hypothetical protein